MHAPTHRYRLTLSFACLVVVLLSAAGALAQAPAAAATAAPPPSRLVLCWYMVCFGNSVDGYKQEIALAQRHGIDGFLLDVGAWDGKKWVDVSQKPGVADQIHDDVEDPMYTDWYVPSAAAAQTDPCAQSQPGNYRAIRGDSWSWYGCSQRATDREFSSQNCAGHACYGLRVVLPEAGCKKLTLNMAQKQSVHPAIAAERRRAPA